MQIFCSTCQRWESDYNNNPNLFYVIKQQNVSEIHGRAEDPNFGSLEDIYFDRVLFSLAKIDLHLWRCCSCEGLYIFGNEENSIVSYKLISNKGMPYFYNPKESLRTFEDYPSTYTPSSIECSCGNKKVKHAYLDNWHYKLCPWVKEVTAANESEHDPAIMNMADKDILPFFLDMSFNVYMCNQCNNLHVVGLDEKQKPFIAEYALLRGKAP